MKALPFKIPKPSNTAIIFQEDRGFFYGQLHQHEELQISLIKKGHGTLVVADTVHHYSPGDLLILGGQQPHVFSNQDSQGWMHTVFYSPQSFGQTFIDLEEGHAVAAFYDGSKTGYKTHTTPDITALFDHIAKARGIHRLSYFLQLLAVLDILKKRPLSSFVYHKKISDRDGKKMHHIFDYTLAHFNRPIYLEEIAEIATMTPNAFCKYFKKRTNKTYFQFLTELRVTNACKLLRNHPEMAIAEIALTSGFQTLSHFNRKFKGIKSVSPREFRKL